MVARRAAAAIAAAVATLTPALALACPMCAGRAGGGPGQWIILAGFVLLPFPVAGAVISYIRSESLHEGVASGEKPPPRSDKTS